MLSSLMTQLSSILPDRSEWLAIAISAGIITVSLFLAHYIGKLIAPRICRIIEGKEEIKHINLLEASGSIMGNLMAATVIGAALYSYQWPPHARILLALTMSACVAMTIQVTLRGLKMSFWSAIGVSMGLFIWTLSNSLDNFGLQYWESLGNIWRYETADFKFSLQVLVKIIAVSIILVAAVRLGSRLVTILLERNNSLDDGQKLLGEKLANVAMIIVAFMLAIDILGIDLTALAFFSGAFGLAIGFGLQKTFGNLISGIILLMDRSIKPGDVIAIGDSFGWVNKIGIRAVSIVTRDGKEHLIPNENMMTNEVENWSYSSKDVRVRIPIGVAYNSDITIVENILLDLAKDHKRILKNPAPKALIKGFGDNSVDFEFRIWIRDPEEGVSNIKSDIMKQIWHNFHEHGVEFPFPQRDIYIKSTPKDLNLES